MPSASVNGVRLAYDDEGSGPPLVLIHGSWTNRHGWDLVAPKLAARFRVVRFDRRGHSESENAPGTIEDDVRDILALGEHLGLGSFHLVCSSHGGVIGLRLAAGHPEAVRSIVSHEPPAASIVPGGPDEFEAIGDAEDVDDRVVRLIDAGESEAAARLFVEEAAFGPGAWDRFPRAMRAMFVENAHTYAEELRDPNVDGLDLDALGRLDRPVLLTRSDDSPPWFRPIVDRLAAVLPRVETHLYRGGGHNPQGNVPDEYVRVVGDFVARTAAAG